MNKNRNSCKYVYGPVSSWRLGKSLGVDAVGSRQGKICSFNCIYCQVAGHLLYSKRRKVFVSAGDIIAEIKSLPPALELDYITFSGAGEPTLARNLGQLIRNIRKIRREKIAVLTNSSLIYRKDVQRDLALADFVVAKLDAVSQELFKKINQPAGGMKSEIILKSLERFRNMYKGKFALQIMFVKENKASAGKIAEAARKINPDEIQLNTPLRPCAAAPLSKTEILAVKKHFREFNTITVYDKRRKKIRPVDKKETLRRRGNF